MGSGLALTLTPTVRVRVTLSLTLILTLLTLILTVTLTLTQARTCSVKKAVATYSGGHAGGSCAEYPPCTSPGARSSGEGGARPGSCDRHRSTAWSHACNRMCEGAATVCDGGCSLM